MNVHHFILVGIGGAIGSMARYGLGQLVGAGPGGWPMATFLVNVGGGLLMGLLAGVLLHPEGGESARLLLGVGLLGGFTTFSAFSLELLQLVERGQAAMAFSYAIGSVTLALLAVAAGAAIGRHWA